MVQHGFWLETATLSVPFSDSEQQFCERTKQLKWDEDGGPGAACMKTFVVSQVSITYSIGEGEKERETSHVLLRTHSVSGSRLKPKPGVSWGARVQGVPAATTFLQGALLPIFLLLAPHAFRWRGERSLLCAPEIRNVPHCFPVLLHPIK